MTTLPPKSDKFTAANIVMWAGLALFIALICIMSRNQGNAEPNAQSNFGDWERLPKPTAVAQSTVPPSPTEIRQVSAEMAVGQPSSSIERMVPLEGPAPRAVQPEGFDNEFFLEELPGPNGYPASAVHYVAPPAPPVDPTIVESEDSVLLEDAASAVASSEASDSEPLPPETLEEFLARVTSMRITTAEHSLSWSLDDAIKAALLYSNRVEELRVDTVAGYQAIGFEFGKFDTVSFLNQRFSDTNVPVGNIFESDGSVDRIKGETLALEYGIRKELASGGQIEIRKTAGTRDENSGALVPRDQANSSLAMRLSKELLRGSGRAIGMNQVLVAKQSARAQSFGNTTAIVQLLESVANAYWNLYIARAQLISFVDNANAAESTWQELQARKNLDADPDLLEQARISAEIQRTAADLAYARLAKIQFAMIQLINAPELLQNLERIEIIPSAQIKFESIAPDILSRQNTAMHNRPEVKQVIENIKRAQYAYHFSLNELLPKLSLTLEGIFNGLAGDRNLGNAAENMFDANASYNIGFNFELPLENRRARFTKRRAELELAKLNLQWKNALEFVKSDVLSTIQEIETSQSLIQRRRSIFKSSQNRLAFLKQRQYNIPQAGAIPSLQLGQLLAAQSQLAGAKADVAAALADRERAQFDLNRASGILVQADTTGLQNPGQHQFIKIYRQYLEAECSYELEADDAERDIIDRSKKHRRTTWRQPCTQSCQQTCSSTWQHSTHHQETVVTESSHVAPTPMEAPYEGSIQPSSPTPVQSPTLNSNQGPAQGQMPRSNPGLKSGPRHSQIASQWSKNRYQLAR